MDPTPWSFGQFIAGIAAAAFGFVLVWQSDWLLRNMGTVPFAEKYLTTEGGSRVFYKLIGILVMIGGIMHAVDLLEPFMGWIWDRFFTY